MITSYSSHKIDQSTKMIFPTYLYGVKCVYFRFKYEVDKFLSRVIVRIKLLVTFTCIYHKKKAKAITFGMK